MRKCFLFILAIFVFFGCASESEKSAIKAISSFYGCSVSYSKGVSASTSEESMDYVGLTLSGGLLDSLDAEEPASYGALTLYQTLSQEEREEYSHIKVTIEQHEGASTKTTEYEYAIGKLQLVNAKLSSVKVLEDNLKQRQYDTLIKQLANSKDVDKQGFVAQMDSLDQGYGEIKDYEFRSFTFFTSEVNNEQKELLELKGILYRSKKNHRFNVILSQRPEDKKVYGVHFN